MSKYIPRLDPLRDGCVYRTEGVTCRLPAMYGTIPPECARCGWFPAEEKRRKLERLGTGKVTVKK